MSAFRLRLKTPPAGRLDMSGLTPEACAGLSAHEVARLPLSSTATVGDHFDVEDLGAASDADTLVLDGTTAACDAIGAGLRTGRIVVDGDAGPYAARFMKGGRLEIKGNAGSYLAAGMSGGVVTVAGSAGDYVGALLPGQKFGMTGGTVHVGGEIGERAGDRMRRGTIIVKGKTGPAAGSRMVGGTIWSETGLGAGPGPLMRRGTLIAPAVEHMLATFADCGMHDMVFLRLMSRHVAETLGGLAPQPLPPLVRRFAGDLETIGKGEILLTA